MAKKPAPATPEPPMFERRQRDPVLNALSQRMGIFEGRMAVFEEELRVVGRAVDENQRLATEIHTGTAGLVAFAADVEIVWKICKRIRRQTFLFAKWLTVVAGAVTAVAACAHVVGAIDVLETLRAWWRR